jgi:hypothetical protein
MIVLRRRQDTFAHIRPNLGFDGHSEKYAPQNEEIATPVFVAYAVALSGVFRGTSIGVLLLGGVKRGRTEVSATNLGMPNIRAQRSKLQPAIAVTLSLQAVCRGACWDCGEDSL